MTLRSVSAIVATTVMLMTGCSESESPAESGTPKPAKGTIEFAILGEDIPYDSLPFTGSLKYAKIEYAYMAVANPTLMPSHAEARGTRHVGITLEGKWAVDLMDPDGSRTPVHLGYMEADSGWYEEEPKIGITKGQNWDEMTDKGGLDTLQDRGVAFCFGGMFVDENGDTYRYEIREPLPSFTIAIEEFPTEENGEAGTKLYVPGGDTLLASFHPHIDHALEVLDENGFDFSKFTQEDGVIVISDAMNATVANQLGADIDVYKMMVGHINRGDHWDVNVIPGD